MTTRTAVPTEDVSRPPGIPAYLHGRKVTTYRRRYGPRPSGVAKP